MDGDAEAGRLQGRVELAVLHQLDGFGEGQVLDLAEILVGDARPPCRMARALSSVPDFGAPTERRLPLRSASVLMPDSFDATTWM